MENINGLQTYLKQIREISLLTQEEEIELAKKVAEGSKEARDRMITANLRLVIMAAKHYTTRTSIAFEDLIQEGNSGLMYAVEKFNPELGYRFSTYAMYWIKQAISRAILNTAKTIRIPIHMLELKTKYNKAQSEFFEKNNRDATTAEMAKILGIPVKKVKEVEELIKDPVSLNTALNDEDDGTIEDLIADENAEKPDDRLDNEYLAKALSSLLGTLDKREEEILVARYGLNQTAPKTLEQLGVVYGLSKERIRQIEQTALRKLRNPMRAALLRECLD
jgi:RNA polymerase primary sigma factor